jgi:hypothetical protein
LLKTKWKLEVFVHELFPFPFSKARLNCTLNCEPFYWRGNGDGRQSVEFVGWRRFRLSISFRVSRPPPNWIFVDDDGRGQSEKGNAEKMNSKFSDLKKQK